MFMNILLIILFNVLFRIQYFLILFVIYKTFLLYVCSGVWGRWNGGKQ
jgi:hypothetical protein